ncbi:cupin domain-containing protein [Halalkalicoccus sp. GCM10025322]|uniref:cupin domain-containing protein n=1 Tax=Halalkalicoccus TaxID=332246 RepID=UPI002F961472
MANDYGMIDVAEAERTPSASSGTDHVDLGSELGCTEMRPKVWDLSPGDAMSYHRQTEQEELYYVFSGPARIRIGDERMDVPEGRRSGSRPKPRDRCSTTRTRSTAG